GAFRRGEADAGCPVRRCGDDSKRAFYRLWDDAAGVGFLVGFVGRERASGEWIGARGGCLPPRLYMECAIAGVADGDGGGCLLFAILKRPFAFQVGEPVALHRSDMIEDDGFPAVWL